MYEPKQLEKGKYRPSEVVDLATYKTQKIEDPWELRKLLVPDDHSTSLVDS